MLRIRNAEITDMDILGTIMALSFRTAFAPFISRETLEACAVEENCAQLLRGIFTSGQMHFVVGELDGTISGELIWTAAEDGAEIMAIHSLPESWGSGLGGAMLQKALADIGGKKVFLWAFADNQRARRFYEKHGFRCTGESRVSEFDDAVEVKYVYEVCGI